jgi:hypothetical protein
LFDSQKWLDWFQKIGQLAKIGSGTARNSSKKKKIGKKLAD